ncbi:MAG: cupredoxin domain-containing protein [Patescibacteria group bacterium]
MRRFLLIFAVFLLTGQGCLLFPPSAAEITADVAETPEETVEDIYDPENIPVTAMPEPAVEDGVIFIRSGNFFFEPATITVKAGELVRLKFDHVMGVHNFVINDLEVNEGTVEGQIIEFTPEKPGEYKFYCSVGSHEERGMFGVLKVEEPEFQELNIEETEVVE